MRTSETPPNDLISALVKAHPKFTAITKSKTAKAGQYSYDYADLHALLDATMPALLANGVTVTQAADWDDDLSMLMLVTRLWHTTGQWLETRFPLKSYDAPQQMGGAITYAKRYCLGALLAVAAEDEDDDAQAAQQAKSAEAPRPKPVAAAKPVGAPSSEAPKPRTKGSISDQQRKRLYAIAKGAGWSDDDMRAVLKNKFHFEHSSDITWSAYDDICKFFAKSPADELEEEREAEAMAADEEQPF